MASSNSPSSSHEPTNLLAAQPPPSTAVSRRLPPPCWSHDETVALIDSYRDKWYSLRRGNLRAPHWQEVADGVAARCPLSNPRKTSIQCRHKMEKLRKRYRAEIQRLSNTPRDHRYPSSWSHFKRMDSMELGSFPSDPSIDPTNQDDEEEEEGPCDEYQDEFMLYPKRIKQAIALPLNRLYHGSICNGAAGVGAGENNGNGVRIKVPNISVSPPPPSPDLNLYNNNRSFDDYLPPMRRKEKLNNDSDLMNEMVAAIHKLGDGFVKMERMKMEMARELESMRMEMEMKRTEMIIESQQRLVDSFPMEKRNNKMKRTPHQNSKQELHAII